MLWNISLEEQKAVPEVVVLPQRAAVSALERTGDLMPDFGLRNKEASIARFADPPAPVDLLPDQEKLGGHQADLFDGLSFDEEGAAASIADVAHGIPLFLQIGVKASIVEAAVGPGIHISARMPDLGRFVVEEDLGAENGGVWMCRGSPGKRGERVGSCHRIVVEKKDCIGPPLERSADADVVPFCESEILRIADEMQSGKGFDRVFKLGILRGVVDEENFVGWIVLSGEGIEAFEGVGKVAIVEDDDRDFHKGATPVRSQS